MSEQELPGSRVRSLLLLAARAVLAVILLVLLFQFVSVSDVATSFLTARVEYLAGGLLLVVANLGLQVLKWRYFVRLMNPESTNLETAASLLFGITLGTVTPGQIGEFGGRALRHTSIRVGAIVGLTMVDRLQMMCVMGIAGTASLTILLDLGAVLTALIVGLAVLAFLGLFFNPQIVPLLIFRVRLKMLQRPWVQDFNEAVAVFRSRQLIMALLLSVTFYLVIYLQMFLLLNAYSSVQPGDAFLGFAAMMFLKALVPISLGDLGVREASSVYFYSLRGIASATSLNAALLLFVINVLFPSIIGLLFVPKVPQK
ncbi:MAG: flippase-like protein [Bacteroidetes bacterium]|nr:flippase-like protein [Bacteroidota bacterium]